MKHNLIYTKPEPEKEEHHVVQEGNTNLEDKLKPLREVNNNAGYIAAYSATLEPTQQGDLFFIISGGERRERHYLHDLMLNKGSYKSLQVIFLPTTGEKSGKIKVPHLGSSPNDIITCWCKIYNEERKTILHNDTEYSLEHDIDHIYFLTDLDDFRATLEQRKGGVYDFEWIIKRHEQNYKLFFDKTKANFEWIISNPCFEIWLYYSFCDDNPCLHFETIEPLEEEKRPTKMKDLSSQLIPGGMNPRKALRNIKRAIDNANKFDPGEDEYRIPLLYGTQFRYLAHEIWERICTEFPNQNRGADLKKKLQGGNHPTNPQ